MWCLGITFGEHNLLRRSAKAQMPTMAELLLETPQDDGELERLSIPVRAFS